MKRHEILPRFNDAAEPSAQAGRPLLKGLTGLGHRLWIMSNEIMLAFVYFFSKIGSGA
jgi:hypothetical protein